MNNFVPSNYPIYYVTCNDISRRFIIITGNHHFTDLSCLLLHPIRNFVVSILKYIFFLFFFVFFLERRAILAR